MNELTNHLAAIREFIEERYRQELKPLAELERLLIAAGRLEPATESAPKPLFTRIDCPHKASKKLAKNSRKPHILQAAKRLPEIITTRELALEAGIPGKDASNFIQRWRQNGWLIDAGPKHYRKAANFGVLDTPSDRGRAMLDTIHSEIEAKKPHGNE